MQARLQVEMMDADTRLLFFFFFASDLDYGSDATECSLMKLRNDAFGVHITLIGRARTTRREGIYAIDWLGAELQCACWCAE